MGGAMTIDDWRVKCEILNAAALRAGGVNGDE